MIRVGERGIARNAVLGTRTVRMAEVQRALRPDEALVEFLLVPDRLIVFVVTDKAVRTASHRVRRADLEHRVRIALDLLGKRDAPAAPTDEVLAGLNAALMDPARSTGLLRTARRLIIAAVNSGAAQTFTFDLSRFTTVPTGTATRWTTVTASGGDRYVRRADVVPSGKLVRLAFPAASVQTVQIDGVVL